ncbi:MAG: hypothetical protein HDS25_01070 [Bacteroides sp.]|nr:hypothetical protein [Bacteroides sp.]
MSTIYYKESFPLAIDMVNPCGVATGVPDFDFEIRLISGNSEFWAGRRNGELFNCHKESDERLIVLVANHDLMPCRDLMCEIYYYLPDDANMQGEIRVLVRRYPTGVKLTEQKCSCASVPSFRALLPYIKGEDGIPGRDGSDAGISIVGFMEFVTDRDIYRVPVLKVADTEPEAADYYYYYSSGYIRIGDWDIDLENPTDESEAVALNEIGDNEDNINESEDEDNPFL